MRVALLTISLLLLLIIFFQDVKERRVYWFLFPFIGISLGWLNRLELGTQQFLIQGIVNLGIVLVVLSILFGYAKFKIKRPFNQVFGLGDLLFFLVISFSFPTISFIVLFVGGVLFSGSLHLASFGKKETVPLAGYMALFFAICLLVNELCLFQSIYDH